MDPFDIVFDSSTNKKNNNVFYHMFCINDALARFQKTYKKIEYSLINDIKHIYVNCVGNHKCLFDSPIGWPKWLKIRYERSNYTNDPPIV
jgi:hypothetical protein